MMKARRIGPSESKETENIGSCQEIDNRTSQYMAACGLLADDIWFVFNGDGRCLKALERPWNGQKIRTSPVECKVHECCSQDKGHSHCGLCDEFPCETYVSAELPCMVANCTDDRREKALKRLHEFNKLDHQSEYWYDEYEYFGTSIII